MAKLNLAAKIVAAFRSVVNDPAQAQRDAAQNTDITALQGALAEQNTNATEFRAALVARLDANDAADNALLTRFDEDHAELVEAAVALAGPPDDPTDNGVVAEVQPAPGVETSPAADAAVA